jgi:hypothetical protein
MKKTAILATLTAAVATAVIGMSQAQQTAPSAAPQAAPQRNVNDWLLNAPDDTARFRLIQRYLRGFDQPMWEVGERYMRIYEAIGDRNWDLAVYHWEKLRDTIVNGYLKRPLRQNSADAIFVNNIYPEFLAALKAKDEAKIRELFPSVRQSCMSCHEAERVPFMNQQAMFRTTERLP